MEVRTIITDALSRANIVPRRQTAPGDLMLSAYKLLQGIVSSFNNDNYLVFTQGKLDMKASQTIHIYDQTDLMAGEDWKYFDTIEELQDPLNIPTVDDIENDIRAVVKSDPRTVYVAKSQMPTPVWDPRPYDQFDPQDQAMMDYVTATHLKVKDVAKLNSLNVNRGSIYGMFKLGFVPSADFDSYNENDLLWTFTQLGEGEWVIRVKPYVAKSAPILRLDYNRALRFDIDTDLRIPEAYLELLIVALTHKLAVKFPRMDDAQVDRLASEVQTMLDNVSTPKADAKMVLRENEWGDDRCTPEGLMRGAFL